MLLAVAKNRTKTGKFRKGHSGNPKGRPRKRRDSADLQLTPVSKMDGWSSALTGIGLSAYDKRLSAEFAADTVDYQTAVELVRGDDVASKAVEDIVDETVRGGFEFSAKVDDAEEAMDLRELISQRWEDLDALNKLGESAKYERAFGGGAVLIGANDGNDLRRPLDYSRIRSVDYLTPLEPRELAPLYYYADPLAPKFGEIAIYRASPFAPGMSYDRGSNAVSFEVHESRLAIFPGHKITRTFQNGTTNGWGDSVLTLMWRVLRDFNSLWDSVGIIANDFSQAIFKIEGLAQIIAQDADEVFRNRLRALELGRSVARAAVLDVNEEFERKATTITGIPELLDRYEQRMAAATGMPVTRLFGRSPAGMNATGESDTRNWYDTVDAWRVLKMVPPLKRITKALLAEAGAEPSKWEVVGCTLWQESDKERAETRQLVSAADKNWIEAGVFYPEEVARGRFGADGFSVDLQVDFDAREELEAEQEAMEAEIEARAGELAKEQAAAQPPIGDAEPGQKPGEK